MRKDRKSSSSDFPTQKDDFIPVFLASDENYVPFVSTTAISIMKNTKSLVKFFILSADIKEERKNELLKLCRYYPNCQMEFIDIDMSLFKNFPEMGNVTLTTYCRYLIPSLKPELGKVIYSDVDVIFADDIKKLYNESLNGFTIAATHDFVDVKDLQLKEKHYKNLEINSNHLYFWAGLMLIDIKKFNSENLTEKLLAATDKYKEYLICMDLDFYNHVFQNNYHVLHPKYVFIPNLYDEMIEMGGEYKQAALNPFIYHYAGQKPWKYPDMPFADKFWKIAEESDFYSEIKNKNTTVADKNVSDSTEENAEKTSVTDISGNKEGGDMVKSSPNRVENETELIAAGEVVAENYEKQFEKSNGYDKNPKQIKIYLFHFIPFIKK